MRKRKAGRPGNAIEGLLDSFTLFRRPYVPTVTGRARELEFERDCSDVQRLDLAELIRGVVSVVRRVLVVGEVETDVVLARGRLDEGVLGVAGLLGVARTCRVYLGSLRRALPLAGLARRPRDCIFIEFALTIEGLRDLVNCRPPCVRGKRGGLCASASLSPLRTGARVPRRTSHWRLQLTSGREGMTSTFHR